MLKKGDKIIWKNKNTDTIQTGVVKSKIKDLLAIGNHLVSWVKIEDIEVIEVERHEGHRKKSFFGI